MSQENVGIARSIYAAWERGDFSSADWADPGIETVIADGPAPGRSTGVSGAAELWGNFLNAWEGYRSQAEEYRELDDERVLVLISRTGRGKRSGIELGEIASEGAVLYHIQGGRVTRQVVYVDRANAFADLGLEE